MESHPGPTTVENYPIDSLTPGLVREFVTLCDLIWPTAETLEQKIDWTLKHLERLHHETGKEQRDTEVVWHFVRAGNNVAAAGQSFRRVVATSSGRRFPVLALAGVCTHPDHRNRGLARQIVLAAWSRLNVGLPVCFFATGVPDFYQRMGARIVSNVTYNDEKPSRAFDPYAMIFPAQAPWPDEPIDLLGPVW